MHYYSSSNASSVYSQDGVLYPLPYDADLKKPLVGMPSGLGRKESSGSARSKTPSNFSQASTLAPTIVYTEDFIKTLGYRPFEYWTGPPPVAVGGLPVPPPPPKAALRRASRVLLLRQSLRLPQQAQARLRDSMMNLMLSGENKKPKQRRPVPVPPAPPSPRVKDRYKPPRKGNEWPDWEPDESALRYFEKQQQQQQQQHGEKKGRAVDTSTNEKRTTTLLAAIPETEFASRTINKKKAKWRSSKKQQQQRPLSDFWPGSSSSSPSSSWALQQTRNKLDFFLHGDRNRTISDSGSSIQLGEHNNEQRLLDPRTWTRRGWGVFALLAMLLLGVALLLASTVAAEAAARATMVAGPTGTTTVNESSSGKTTQQQQLEQQQQEQEQNLMVAGPDDDDDDDDGGTVVHGGSLFRFRAIQRTYHGLVTP